MSGRLHALGHTGAVVGLQASRIGDTALSASEESREEVRELRIDHAAFGVAGKDLSHAWVEQAVMAAYRKKGECGPASIDARTVTMVRVEARSLCELDPSAELEGVKTTCRGVGRAAPHRSRRPKRGAHVPLTTHPSPVLG